MTPMTTSRDQRPSAVVWLNERHAIVARTLGDERISMTEVQRGTDAETQYLAHVVHEIGDLERVMLVGPSSIRIALEREFTQISHRPDRLVALSPAARREGADIVDRLRRLAA